jgi:hypothetical protein
MALTLALSQRAREADPITFTLALLGRAKGEGRSIFPNAQPNNDATGFPMSRAQ